MPLHCCLSCFCLWKFLEESHKQGIIQDQRLLLSSADPEGLVPTVPQPVVGLPLTCLCSCHPSENDLCQAPPLIDHDPLLPGQAGSYHEAFLVLPSVFQSNLVLPETFMCGSCGKFHTQVGRSVQSTLPLLSPPPCTPILLTSYVCARPSVPVLCSSILHYLWPSSKGRQQERAYVSLRQPVT